MRMVMSNHYHLVLRTPKPNLVGGMKWLQSTFATRFNRFRNEKGHVFQGRYKALLVEPGKSFLGLINYVHLNPVRASVCTVEDLKSYALSSYPKFWKRTPAKGLDRSAMLSSLEVPNTLAGMRLYKKQLQVCEANDTAQKEALMQEYCRGWFIGSEEGKAELTDWLTKDFSHTQWDPAQFKELTEAQWESIVVEELKRAVKKESDILSSPKSIAWKVNIALRLRKETSASNPWIAKRLNMGHPSRISNLLRASKNI